MGDIKRSSNLELYRIVCMIMIVAHHYVVNSGLTSIDAPLIVDPATPNSLYLWTMGMWGKTGINCFMMITGYFMCKSTITLKKFLKLLLQVYIYKIIIFVVFVFIGYESISILKLLKLAMPIWDINQNFTSCFIVFWLTIPFWNILIQNMTKKQHELVLGLLLCIYTFLGSIPKFGISFNYVTWFGVIYLIASYTRLYPHPIFDKKKLWFYLSILCILFAIISMCVMVTFVGGQYALFFVSDANKFFAVSIAITTFLWFKNLKISYNSIINIIGGSTFGVLLIHANSDAMRQWLWKDTVDCVGHYTLPLGELILYSIGIVLSVFFTCVIIDRIRIKFLEEPFFKWFDKKYI